MFGITQYNYESFSRDRLLKDLTVSKFGGAPEPGDRAPDFEAQTLEGDKVRLKNFRGEKNVVLTFGSATCPQTAASLPGLNQLYRERTDDVEFLFVYVREAHPGERIPAHQNEDDKRDAAELLRAEENVDIPMIVDDLGGRIHRKYGRLPNASFLIDKSGRVAFRSLFTRPAVIGEAIEELLEVQKERGLPHAVVLNGEDLSLPPLSVLLRARRALERGGRRSLRNFEQEMGLPGRLVLAGSRVARPIVENPGRTAAGVAAALAVIGAGIWVGLILRQNRLSTYRSPYETRRFPKRAFQNSDDYEAVGI